MPLSTHPSAEVRRDPGSARSRLLGELAADLHRMEGLDATAAAVTARSVELLPSAVHASLMLRTRRARCRSTAATSPVAAQVDDLQHSLGEGPGLTASARPGWVHSADVALDPRWPAWGVGAAETGVRAVLSVHLEARGAPVGALNLYAERSGGFADDEEVGLAVTWSSHAASALDTAHRLDGLEKAITSHHAVGMAQGILMERYSLDEDESFALLRRLSSTRNRKLRTIADDLVRTRRLDDPPERGPHPPGPAPAGR